MNRKDRITEATLTSLVDRFYAKVRQDPMIGPLFNGAVDDWPEHLQTLSKFWSSVMLTTGTYKGNPMAVHNMHAAQIAPPMFDRWLALWKQTTDEIFVPEEAAKLQDKAVRIAESLKMGLAFHAARPKEGG